MNDAGDERRGHDGGGSAASHCCSRTLVASQNGMTPPPPNQNSRHQPQPLTADAASPKNNGGGGGGNNTTTGGGVSTRSKASTSPQPSTSSSAGTKSHTAAEKKRAAKNVDNDDTDDDAPTASSSRNKTRTKANPNKKPKKANDAGITGTDSGSSSGSNDSGTAVSTKRRSRAKGADDDGAGGDAVPSAAVAATVSNKSSTSAFVESMNFANLPPNKDLQLLTNDAPVCTDENCDDEECDPSSSYYAVGTPVELYDDKEKAMLTGDIIFHPCAMMKDGNNYLVETERGIYIVSIEDIGDYILSSDGGSGGDDNSDPKYGVGTMVERDWAHREGGNYLAKIVAIPCPGGCNGMCSDTSNGMKCGGRGAYLVEYLDDGYREIISSGAISDFVVGEAQDVHRLPPRPATLDVLSISLSMAGLGIAGAASGRSNGGGVEEVPSAQANYKRSTKQTVKTSLRDTNIVRVDPTNVDECHVGICACGNTAQTKLKVKNKGPGQHPDTTCWECATNGDYPIKSYVQNSAACLCCAERYHNFRNCKECVQNLRCCKFCEKLGCYDTTRVCKDCFDADKLGAGKKCKTCNKMGTYRQRNYCYGCWLKRRDGNDSAVLACPRCLTPKTSVEYVPVHNSNVCSDCYNGGNNLCKAWIADGVLCTNIAAVQSGDYRGPLCNSHRRKCEKVAGRSRKDARYFLKDENGGFNEGWAHK